MSLTFAETVTLIRMDCDKCGGVFALNASFEKRAREYGTGWSCPYCKTGWSYAETEIMRLQKAIDEKSRALTASKCETLNERNLREQAERKLLRTKRGVCACCNRSFQNLGRHMKTKHPDFLVKP